MKQYIWLGVSLILVLALGLYTDLFVTEPSPDIEVEYPPLPTLWPYTFVWGLVCVGGMVYQFRSEIRENYNQIRNKLRMRSLLPELLLIELLAVSGALLSLNTPLNLMYTEVAIAILAVYSYARYRKHYTPLPWLSYALAALPLTTAISCLYTGYPEKGIAVLNLQLMLLLPWARGLIDLKQQRVRGLFGVLFHLALAVLIYHLMIGVIYLGRYTEHIWDFITLNKLYMSHLPDCPPYWPLLSWLHYPHPTAAMFLLLTIGLIYSYHQSQQRANKLPSGIVWVYFSLTLVLSLMLQSRYGMLGSVGCLLGWGFMYIRRNVSISLKRLCFSLLLVGGVLTIGGIALGLGEKLSFFGDSLRLQVFGNALDMWYTSPVMGLGAGSDGFVHLEKLEHIHAHSILLSALVDSGVFGGLVVLLIYATLIWESIARKNTVLGLFALLWIPLSCLDSVFYSSTFCYISALFFFLLLAPKAGVQTNA